MTSWWAVTILGGRGTALGTFLGVHLSGHGRDYHAGASAGWGITAGIEEVLIVLLLAGATVRPSG